MNARMTFQRHGITPPTAWFAWPARSEFEPCLVRGRAQKGQKVDVRFLPTSPSTASTLVYPFRRTLSGFGYAAREINVVDKGGLGAAFNLWLGPDGRFDLLDRV